MRTASALTRHCGYVTKLSKARPRSKYVQATAAEGTRFGKLVQDWCEGNPPAPPETLDDPWCWYEDLRNVWTPPPGVRCEVALGLSRSGSYIEVQELLPHVYTPTNPKLLGHLATAGRADLVWTEGEMVVVADLKRSAFKYGDPARHPQLMALGCAAALAAGADLMALALYGAKDAAWERSEPMLVRYSLPEVMEMAALSEDEPKPGPWCGGCYEKNGCEAAELETP